MRKLLLLLSLLLCLPLSIAAQDPDVTLNFPGYSKANESTALTSATFKTTYPDASQYISSISTVTKVYATKEKGLKLGAASSQGTLTLTLNTDLQKDIEKISIIGQLYNASKAANVTINSISPKSGSFSGTESEIIYTDFTNTVNGKSLKIDSEKYVCISSISIYFKKEIASVDTPTISCSDNKVSISCATDDANIYYSINDGEFAPYEDPFSITETCTVKAKASKDGMADSEIAEQECVFVAPGVTPSMPVVTINGDVAADEEINVDYGTKISISAENATSLRLEYGSDSVTEEGDSYEFNAEANETYMVTPINDYMPEGEKEGDSAMFTITINAPEILSVLNGEEAIIEGSTIFAKQGTEILVNAKSYSKIVVENEDGEFEVADGKFAITIEGLYTITVSNPACTETDEIIFEVTYPDEPEYEEIATLDWNITGVDTVEGTKKLRKDDESANGDWIVEANGAYADTQNGAHLGSGSNSFVNGTLTLSTSDIPEDAIITGVGLKGIPGNVEMEWTVSVNEQTAGILRFPTNGTSYGVTNHTLVTIDNLNIEGNSIVFKMTKSGTDAQPSKKAFYLSGISVSYQVLAEPSAPEFEMPATIEHGATIVYTVKHGKIHYHIATASAAKSPMLRASEPTDNWTVSKEEGGKQFTYEYASGNNHNIFVKNVVNGKEVHGEAINVNGSGVITGIEAVGADAANGEVELYNLQGVRVNPSNALPGLYIERRNGKATKVLR